MSYPGDKQSGGGEQPFRSDVGRFADGLTQINRAPLNGIPAPPKCARYGDAWADSSEGFSAGGRARANKPIW